MTNARGEASAMPGHVRRQFEIRRKLDAIAPLADGPNVAVTATELARHFAVRALERFIRAADPRVPYDAQQNSQMCAEFAAAHALAALAGLQAEVGTGVATQIRDALEDGGEIGGWLYEHLGADTAKAVSALTDELTEAAGGRTGD
jgi:hypothetical protein